MNDYCNLIISNDCLQNYKCKLDVNICDSFHLLSYFPKAIWSTTFKLQIQYISRYISSVLVYCIITLRTSKRKDADTHLFNNVT